MSKKHALAFLEIAKQGTVTTSCYTGCINGFGGKIIEHIPNYLLLATEKQTLTEYLHSANEYRDHNIKLLKENKTLKEGLDYYADKDNWVCDIHCRAECTSDGCSNEGGAIARKVRELNA